MEKKNDLQKDDDVEASGLPPSAPVQGAVQVAQPALQGLLQRRFLCGVAVGILIEAWWFRRTDR